jgi:hypothetical protein
MIYSQVGGNRAALESLGVVSDKVGSHGVKSLSHPRRDRPHRLAVVVSLDPCGGESCHEEPGHLLVRWGIVIHPAP